MQGGTYSRDSTVQLFIFTINIYYHRYTIFIITDIFVHYLIITSIIIVVLVICAILLCMHMYCIILYYVMSLLCNVCMMS